MKLEGDHGNGSKIDENEKKWFTHVVIGAQRKLTTKTAAVLVHDALTGYDKVAMEKSKISFTTSPTPPPDAIVVSGKYVSSRNVAGVSRAFLGMMSGKSWNRAEITIRRGDATLFQGTLDGKFLGGGYSWGYETLIVNEGLGAGIAGVIRDLQRGVPVEVKR